MYYCLVWWSLIYNINLIINIRISDNLNNGINNFNIIKYIMSDIDVGFFMWCGIFIVVFFVCFI